MSQANQSNQLEIAAERILRAVGEMHQRNRTVASAYGAEVSVVDSSILVEISANPTVSADTLCTSFQLSAVQMSRTLKKLEQDGILERQVSDKDRRSRVLRLTPKGQKVLDYVSQRSRETFSAAYQRIPRSKHSQFTQFAKRFCGNLSAVESVHLTGDPPLLLEVRKLTRALGMLSPKIFGFEKLTPLEWHVLRLLQQRARFARDLCSELGVPANTMTGILKRLEDQGYLSKRQDHSDRRAWVVQLREAGHLILEECAASGRSIISRGLRNFEPSEAMEFSALVDSYAGTGAPTDGIFLAAELLCKKLSTPEEYGEARRFIFEQRVAQELLDDIPESAAQAESITFALYRRGSIEALVELQGETLAHALVKNPRLSEEILKRFLEQLRVLLHTLGIKLSTIPETQCSKQLRPLLQVLLSR